MLKPHALLNPMMPMSGTQARTQWDIDEFEARGVHHRANAQRSLEHYGKIPLRPADVEVAWTIKSNDANVRDSSTNLFHESSQ
jgi:hypothetical protein